jgi:tetratricopeptide (TPR) repeat protein
MFLARMKISLAVILTGLAVFSRLAAATLETPAVAAVEPLAKEIDTLIRELADDSFRVRENASRDIWKLGDAALPALQEASTSTNPEQASRARDLIRKIQLHITAETDPEIIALVERYAKASLTEKITLFAQMRMKGAWRQMLKLHAAETHAEIREKLQPAVHGIALKAARERLLQGDAREAREFLEMAPANPGNLLALAEFHRSHGTLEAELQRTRTVTGRKSAAWQLALQRAAGNLEAARDAAKAAGDERITAIMAALSGDPIPWLRQTPDILKADTMSESLVATYTTVAIKRWLGQKMRPTDIDPLRKALMTRHSEARGVSMNALFLLGEATSAEAAFAKSAPLAAFRYFDSLERIPDALKSLGLDPDHPDYKSWIEKRLRKISTNDIEDQKAPAEDTEELVALASFLENKGLHEELAAAFSEPMATFAEKHESTFVDLLGALFGHRASLGGAPLLAKRIGMAWAGDHEKHWDALVDAAFGDDDMTRAWWDWLADLDPKASRNQRLDAMLALYGCGKDPSGLQEKWLALAWQAALTAPARERDSLIERISALSIEAGDVANSLKAWDLLPEISRKEIFWGEHILHLSAGERWDEAAAVILQQIKLAKESKQELSIAFHAYAAAALRQAGHPDQAAIHDSWVDKLVLGNPIIAIQTGNGYAFGRDYQRAAQWWARAAREADPDSGEFAIALKLHAGVLLEGGKWKECAATSEVLSRMYVMPDMIVTSPLPLMRLRLQADMARALATLKTDRPGALALLEKSHRSLASDGSLADFFFPALRQAGLIKEHDAWFRESWSLMEKIIANYPLADNTRNTAAWFASRALRNLDEAEKHLTKALAANPHQSAYLDTMAEIQFAKGNREKALEWSRTAVNFLPNDAQLRRQQERYRSDPLPK